MEIIILIVYLSGQDDSQVIIEELIDVENNDLYGGNSGVVEDGTGEAMAAAGGDEIGVDNRDDEHGAIGLVHGGERLAGIDWHKYFGN